MDIRNRKNRVVKDIPELVAKLRDQRSRCEERIVPLDLMGFTMGEDNDTLRMAIEDPKLEKKPELFGMRNWAHRQLATKTDIPWKYYSRMLVGAQPLLVANVNHWIDEMVVKAPEKKILVRFLDGEIRALLSNKYRIINHLDLVTEAVRIITGQDGNKENPYARGAKCFSWTLNPYKVDVGFVNPGITVDLNNLDKGVQHRETGLTGSPGHSFFRVQGFGGEHLVFPAGFVENDECGGGSAKISGGLYEGMCDNGCRIGHSLLQRHLGKALEMEDLASEATIRKQNELVFSKFGDVFRAVFDPDSFLKLCKRFKGLKDQDVEDVPEAVDHVIKLAGLDEGLRDDILAAYTPVDQGRDTTFDVQRAFTHAAHGHREGNPETAAALERTGGDILLKGSLQIA